jgi:hypothetical protein
MNTFGTIKTKIEYATVNLYGKPEFKSFMKQFKSMVLENKDVAELYYIYDDLSSKKGLDKSIADDYLNESVEYSQVLIENCQNSLGRVSNWIDSVVMEHKNDYSDIDTTIYNRSIKNLEVVLESKKNIKNTLISEEVKTEVTNFNLPLSSVVRAANDSISRNLESLDESDRKELTSILSLNIEDVKTEIESLKENILNNLKTNLNESTDTDLTLAIENTINKVNGTKIDHYNLYKLRKLNSGL